MRTRTKRFMRVAALIASCAGAVPAHAAGTEGGPALNGSAVGRAGGDAADRDGGRTAWYGGGRAKQEAGLVNACGDAASGCGQTGGRMNGCGDRAAVLGEVAGGCVSVPPGSTDYLAGLGGAPPDLRGADLPQLPISVAALPAGALPVSLGATPALPRLDDSQADRVQRLNNLPGLLPGALPRIRVRSAARSLPGLPSIPVVRPVPSRTEAPVEGGVREPTSALQLGALALGGLLTASGVIFARPR
jgi:hypothetical protein